MSGAPTLAITGGTGFVGGHLLRIAGEAGWGVRALTRGWRRPDERITWIEGALDQPAALASLCSARPRHWCLDYAVGYDVALEPSDEDWSTATLVDTGHLEVLDGGPAGLWRVVRDLPADLVESTSDSVGLVRTTSHAVWYELAILAAG